MYMKFQLFIYGKYKECLRNLTLDLIINKSKIFHDPRARYFTGGL